MASSTSNAKAYVDDYYPSFREFKDGLAGLLSHVTITKLIDRYQNQILLKEDISIDENDTPLRMIEIMEDIGQIKPHDISALLKACYELDLHREMSSVERLFQENRVMVGDPLTLMSHCSETIALRKIDSKSVHTCTVAILGNASMNEFPIPNLRLHRTFRKAKGGDIILQSGLQFTCPFSVQKIVLNSFGENKELTKNEMINLLVCAGHAHALMELQLRYFHLPESISVDKIPEHFIVPKMTDFGRFKERLVGLLTDDIMINLATFFMFPPNEIDQLRRMIYSPRLLMISLMEEMGKIKPTNFSPLLSALDKLEIHRFYQGPEDFDKFKERLAELLTNEIILKLASLFMFPPDKTAELRRMINRSRLRMVSLMETWGKIKPKDISPLLTALDKLEIYRFFQGPEVSWVSYYEAFHLNTRSGRWKSFLSHRELNRQDYATLATKNKGKAKRTTDTKH